MKLKSLTVENYRSFEAPATIELRPLTLLFGYNSQGKSALLRALPLLAASVGGSDASPLNLDTELTREASFNNLLCHLNGSDSMHLELALSSGHGDLADLRLDLREDANSRRHIIERLHVSTTDVSPDLDLRWDLSSLDQAAIGYRATVGDDMWPVSLVFDGINPVYDLDLDPKITGRLRRVQLALRKISNQVHWLSALRKVPQRWASYRRRINKLGADGSGVTEVLAADALEGGKILQRVSGWFEETTGFQLHLPEGAGRNEVDLFSLEISPPGAAFRIPLVDTGEGMIQVLPVLVLAAMAELGELGEAPVLALEHPELHLHPAAHAKLADIFCQTASKGEQAFLIETHSENLLRKVQLSIAQQRISPDRVLIYWIQQDASGRSTAEPIELDELAVPKGYRWPPGVFSEASEIARELALLRRELRSA